MKIYFDFDLCMKQDDILLHKSNKILITTIIKNNNNKTMLSDDQTRILSSMLICIPLSYAIPKIPSTLARNLYSFLLGTLLQFYIYGKDIYIIFILHFIVYAMVKLNPANCGKQVTIVSLALLSTYHIYRMIVDYGGWTLDVSTIMMSNVNKYSLFAFSVQDGRAQLNKLTKQQIKQKLQKIPSIFSFLGYCQFLPCSPLSLAFPYKYYQDYMHLRNQYVSIPSPWKAVGQDVLISVGALAVYAVNMFVFPLSKMQDPNFDQAGFWYIVVYAFFCVTTLRFKYYFGWKLSMGAVHASGVSYQLHANDTSDFKLIQTCHPYMVQSTMHVRQKIYNWNMTCQQWLRKCVYQRSHYKNKNNNQLLTFLVSAFWHGFYGGYYFSFVLWFIHVFIAQLVFKESKKQKSPYVKIYKKTGVVGKVALWLTSNVAFNVGGIFFQVLSLKQSIKIMKALYFGPIIFYLVAYLIFTKGATRQKRVQKAKQQQQSHQHKDMTHTDKPKHKTTHFQQDKSQK